MIYRTVSSESQDSNVNITKTMKRSSVSLEENPNFVDVNLSKITFLKRFFDQKFMKFCPFGMIYTSNFRSRRDLSHCILRISRFQHNSMKNHQNIISILNQKSKCRRRTFSKIHVSFDDVSIKR